MTGLLRRTMTALAIAVCVALPARAGDTVTVFAAASLKTALDEIAALWEERSGDDVVLSYAGSSALARQIEAGAPADLFLSANEDWMDRLERAGRVDPVSRRTLLGNRLVLIASDPAAPAVAVDPAELQATLAPGRLALALVDAVPAGIYARAALEHYGIWEPLAPSVVQADNVRAALALVATGAAPYGIVYATDAVAEPRVGVVASFPPESHPPIRYPAALVAGRDSGAAARFLDHLAGAEAASVFARNGFVIMAGTP